MARLGSRQVSLRRVEAAHRHRRAGHGQSTLFVCSEEVRGRRRSHRRGIDGAVVDVARTRRGLLQQEGKRLRSALYLRVLTITHLHPEVVALLVGRGELNLPTGCRDNDALTEQTRGLDVRVLDCPHARDEYCCQLEVYASTVSHTALSRRL